MMNQRNQRWALNRLLVAVFIFSLFSLPAAQPVSVEASSTINSVYDLQGSAPVLTTSGGSPTFVENTAGVAVDNAIQLTGPTINGATVSITGGFISSQDRLDYTTTNGITGSYNTSTGILTLSGSGTADAYQGALQAVLYRNISDTPNTADRTISIAVGDVLYNPDNQHFYEFISSSGISWSTARNNAAASTQYGMQGYLATITSSEENAFVTGKLEGVGWIGASDAASEGAWKWVTGPESGQQFWQGTSSSTGGYAVGGMFANWNSGEPNNSGNENYGHMIFNTAIGVRGSWNDLADAGGSGDYSPQGYLVEYGDMAGDPTVSLTADVTVHVQTANDAPVLNTGYSPIFVTILEDAPVPTAETVAAIVPDGSITDPDGSAVEAIAVTAVDGSLGSWQFSTDAGATWTAFGAVSEAAARLLDATAFIRLIPAANVNGTASAGFTFRAWDQTSGSNGGTADVTTNGGSTAFSAAADTVSINITAVNDPPTFTVGPDQVVYEDSGLQTVSNWATDISVGPADESWQTIGTVASPSNWALFSSIPQVNQYNGTLKYTLAANANGEAIVTVSFTDNGGNLNGGYYQTTKTFKITVLPVNDAPTGTADSYATDEDTTLTRSAPGVLANDSDIDGDSLTAVLVSGPAHGTVTLNADGSFTYTPATNSTASDSFTYQAFDGSAGSETVTVSITVNPVNDPPVAADDTATTLEDTAKLISVLPNDSDVEGDALSICAVGSGAHGTTSLNTDLPETRILYTPELNFNGSDSFSYDICDGNGGTDTGAVTVTVTPVNDAPSFTIGSDVTVSEDCGAQSIPGWATNLSPGPADENGQTLMRIVVIANPPLFDVMPSYDLHDGTLTFTPAADAYGSTMVKFYLSDSGGTENGGVNTSAGQSFRITIESVNDAPVGTADSYSVSEDEVLTVFAPGVLANDTDVDGDGLTAELFSGPADGALTFAEDGMFSYMPRPNFSGVVSFSYKVSDGTLSSEITTVTITVNGVNDAPTATDDSASTNEDTAQTIDVLANDSDLENDTLVVASFSDPANGSVSQNPDGSLLYTPDLDFNGSDSFQYVVSDGNGGTDSGDVTVDVSAVNDAPSFTPGLDQTVNEDVGAQSIPGWASAILAGPADEAGQALTFHMAADQPDLFSVQPAVDAATGDLTFTPADDANGIALVTVSLSDNGGTALGGVDEAAEAILTITILPQADAPVIGVIQMTGNEDEDLAFTAADFNSAFSDADGDGLVLIEIRSLPEHGTLKLNSLSVALNQLIPAADLGGLHFTPAADWNGSTTFGWNASDGTAYAASDSQVEITIQPGSDAPVAGLVEVDGVEDEPVIFQEQNFIDGYADIDGDALVKVQVVSLPEHGALTLGDQAVTAGQEILAGDLDGLKFIPLADWNGTTTFGWSGNDGTAYAGQDGQVKINVSPVNDAPVLSADQVFEIPSIRYEEANPAGTAVETIVHGVSASDADAAATIGLAVTGMSGDGEWQYSSDGGAHWTGFGALSETEARLLDGQALVRLIPNTDVASSARLIFRLWDQTSGQNGEAADTTVNGGTTAFSTISGQASVGISGPASYNIDGGEAGQDVVYGDWTINLPGNALPDGGEMYIDTVQTPASDTGAINLGQPIQVSLYSDEHQTVVWANQPVEVCYAYSEADLTQAGGDASKLRLAVNYPEVSDAWTTAASWTPQGTHLICTSTFRFPILLRLFIPTLPVTGFAPAEVTVLPEQPEEKDYQAYGDLALEIPSLYVDMPVVSVPLTGDGWDLTWLSDQAGYLRGTTFPTWVGNTVLTGHVYLADGTRGPFWGLSQLERGDEMILYAWGHTYTYVVRKVSLVDPQDLDVLEAPAEGTWLTLLTCQDYQADSGGYAWRLAVQAELVEVH